MLREVLHLHPGCWHISNKGLHLHLMLPFHIQGQMYCVWTQGSKKHRTLLPRMPASAEKPRQVSRSHPIKRRCHGYRLIV
ncbi:hypothetical protein M970_081020 [Encephalitozoon cuniculi EcunIII-L]|nr:hypothetical protein M970_081020 [Encephalitozoon cuniculi EcunIII-L]